MKIFNKGSKKEIVSLFGKGPFKWLICYPNRINQMTTIGNCNHKWIVPILIIFLFLKLSIYSRFGFVNFLVVLRKYTWVPQFLQNILFDVTIVVVTTGHKFTVVPNQTFNNNSKTYTQRIFQLKFYVITKNNNKLYFTCKILMVLWRTLS